MRTLAADDEQVSFWIRHTRMGVALCVCLPLLMVGRALFTPDLPDRVLISATMTAAAGLSPLILLVPIARVVKHPKGALMFYAWELVGMGLVAWGVALDGGSRSPCMLIFFVLLIHAALAYPPSAVITMGAGAVATIVAFGLTTPEIRAPDLVATAGVFAIATATCAVAAHNHVLTYRRTAAYAEEFARLARRDGLTGCLTNRAFHEELGRHAAGVGADEPLSVLVADLDRFKCVNDAHGHLAGDAVLQKVAHILTDVTRPGDVVGRLGGDEFALLLPSTDGSAATAVAGRLREQVREALSERYGVTASVGVATTTAPCSPVALLHDADMALYGAKDAGRDSVVAR